MFILARKKAILIIVEGPSDETALGAIFSRIYDPSTTFVLTMHGDLTTQIKVDPGNIVAKIGNAIREFAKVQFLTYKDFIEIIHIVDTDGAYIPNDSIIEDVNATKAIYSESCITTNNKDNIINRNSQKRQNLNKLVATNDIWNIPYKIYFMSANLDHALYGSLNLTDEEKESKAYDFALQYHDNIPKFRNFITNSDFSVMLPYKESWNFIKSDCESLKRHTNLGLCLPEQVNIDNNEP